MSTTRLSALQKAVLYYFVEPEMAAQLRHAGRRYREGSAEVLRWIAELRGQVGRGLFRSPRGGRTSQKLRRSFYRSLQNMEHKELLVREKRRWSGYTRMIELTPEGVRVARSVEPQDFLAPFAKLRQDNERNSAELHEAFARALRMVREQERG